jgi:adenylate cyclase
MHAEDFKRKLTAIFSADVVGYSRLMREDEERTIRTLTQYRKVIVSLISKHRGRVVDSPGDNVLAEFTSVVDALRCGWDIQREIKNRNADLPANRRMNFRIGVNLGDVIQEGERIYGDAVNIAARLESLAEAGGICISGTTYDHVKNKLPLRYDYQGEQTVKNIEDPIRVYRVLIEPDASARPTYDPKPKFKRWKLALALLALVLVLTAAVGVYNFLLRSAPPPSGLVPDKAPPLELAGKASIAVLPFSNLSGDREQEYFSDGITNDIITDLSKFSELFVIASNTVFTFKGEPVDIKEVGRELAVRYVLEGSVQKGSGKVRINAQLIDASTGSHLWAERYDRDIKDLFALQDEIVQRIVATLAVKIQSVERARSMRKDTENLEAYDYVLRGLEYRRKRTRDGSIKAEEMFTQAIELDPSYTTAYVGLGLRYLNLVDYGWTEFPAQALQKAQDLAQKALSLDGSHAGAHALLGNIYIYRGQHELAISELRRAIELNPNDALSRRYLGTVMLWSGRIDDAIQPYEAALRYDPRPSPGTHMNLGLGYYLKGQYDMAINTIERGVAQYPDFVGNYIALAAAYARAGRSEEAARAAGKVLRLDPFFEVASYGTVFRNPADRNAIREGLRKAGLK